MRSVLSSLISVALLAVISAGCGVRQNKGPGRTTPPPEQTYTIDGPFWGSGQRGEDMRASSCSSSVGRPCVRAKASVGMPWQFDTNSNSSAGTIWAGTTVPAGPYTTGAGAGKLRAAPWQPNTRGNLPTLESRDLYMMERQASQ